MQGESAAFSQFALHGHTAAVGLSDVLDDGQTQAGATELAAARLVHPVELFEPPGGRCSCPEGFSCMPR